MMQYQWASLIFLAAALILPLAALRSRKLDGRKIVQLALVWIVIFAGAVLLIKLFGLA